MTEKEQKAWNFIHYLVFGTFLGKIGTPMGHLWNVSTISLDKLAKKLKKTGELFRIQNLLFAENPQISMYIRIVW